MIPTLENDQTIQIIADYQADYEWLWTLITDPTGQAHLAEKSREGWLAHFEQRLARLGGFLAFAGHPERRYPSVHVTGTSGKGSVTSMLAAILTGSGLRTGHHISPYLQIPNEKLMVDQRPIAPSAFSRLIRKFREIHTAWGESESPARQLRYGEAWVALTFLYLAQEQVEWAVMEAGAGGRFDATNLIPSQMALITNVDYDHVKTLGPTLEDIAWHKAGIIKAGAFALTTEQRPGSLAVIEAEAKSQNARLFVLEGVDNPSQRPTFGYTIRTMDPSGLLLDVRGPYHTYSGVRVGMTGQFQAANAALAIAGADVLRAEYNLPISSSTLDAALAHFSFVGRMEVVQQRPLVMLDGAHNPHKAQALVNALRRSYGERRVRVILGLLAIKEPVGIVNALAAISQDFVVTRPHIFAKPPLPVTDLATVVAGLLPHARLRQAESVKEAIELVLPEMGDDELLLITGSLYLVGEARDYWHPQVQILADLENRQW